MRFVPSWEAACQERLWIASLNVFFNRFLIYQHKKSTLWFCYGSQSCPQIFSHNFLWMFSIELPTTEHYIQWGKIQTSYEIFILESWWTFAYYTINTALTLKPYYSKCNEDRGNNINNRYNLTNWVPTQRNLTPIYTFLEYSYRQYTLQINLHINPQKL